MSVETKLYAVLVSDPVLSGLVSTRVYPGILPQSVTYPAVTYTRVSNYPVWCLSGYSGTDNTMIQVDCWAETYAGAKQISLAVLKAMMLSTTFKAILREDRDLYEPDVKVCRVSMDFSTWNQEQV